MPELTGAPDPADADAVADAFVTHVAQRFDCPVALAEPVSTASDGFDSRILFVRLGGPRLPEAWQQPLVLRIQSSPERLELARREAAVQNWCADNGYPSPRVLAVLDPGTFLDGPVQVMLRAPGTTMLDAIRSRPWRTPGLIDRLAALQLQLHALPFDGWPGLDGSASLADRRLAMPREFVPRLGDLRLQRALDRAEVIAAELSAEDPVICHGDFHPMNIVVDGLEGAVIDWTDAALGDRHGDVSRTALLFHLAAIAATGRVERSVLSSVGPRMSARFLRAYRSGAALDERRLRRWEALHCLHGWTQLTALHAGMFEDNTKSGDNRSRVSPALAGWLEARFERAASA